MLGDLLSVFFALRSGPSGEVLVWPLPGEKVETREGAEGGTGRALPHADDVLPGLIGTDLGLMCSWDVARNDPTPELDGARATLAMILEEGWMQPCWMGRIDGESLLRKRVVH